MGQHNTFGLEIYASNRQVYVGRGQSITFPVEDGEMQVLPHHEDMIAAIVPGEMVFVDPEGNKTTVAVSAGFIEVFNNRVKVFALTVERPEEIDIRRAEEAKERADCGSLFCPCGRRYRDLFAVSWEQRRGKGK